MQLQHSQSNKKINEPQEEATKNGTGSSSGKCVCVVAGNMERNKLSSLDIRFDEGQNAEKESVTLFHSHRSHSHIQMSPHSFVIVQHPTHELMRMSPTPCVCV